MRKYGPDLKMKLEKDTVLHLAKGAGEGTVVSPSGESSVLHGPGDFRCSNGGC